MKGIAFAGLGLALACLASPALVQTPPQPTGQGNAVPDQTLRGTLGRADYEHYREIPFTLPAGVTRLTIEFSYGGKEQHSVIDLGLADPQHFRGWSGGTRDRMTLSAEDATPGYLRGPLPAGEWHLILGAPNIREGATAPFEARIYIERAPMVTSFADAPLNAAPGWYRGDLHMHSGNSDGKCLSQKGEKVPCPVYRTVEAAAKRGLDFIALTDHNTTAHYDALRALQGAFDRLLLIPGREVTTFYGHSNVFGPTAFLDFRMTAPNYAQAAKWMDEVKREGGIVSLNHAGAPSGEICMGCGWRLDDLPAGAVQAIEVVNGGTMAETKSAESPLQGFALWQKLLNAGQHVTAIGGSDNHNADLPSDEPGAIGTPTTVVFMRELAVQGFIDGVRAGRAFVDVYGVKGRFLDISATNGEAKAVMGGTLQVRTGERIRLTAEVKGASGGTIQPIVDGEPNPAFRRVIQRDGAIALTSWIADPGRHWVRADVRDAAGRLILVGNPIYIEVGK